MKGAGTFRALWVTEDEPSHFRREILTKDAGVLPPGEILIRVGYSALNYKDALSATGNSGVTRSYPHIPGVDAAGTVVKSSRPEFREGDEVVVTGYELGSHAWGGWSELICVPGNWVVPLPRGLSVRESMILGTAGFTAGLAVSKLLHHGLEPGKGPVLVTGATGGVGSFSVALLSAVGFHVCAVTGKEEGRPFLKSLGAAEVLSREEAAAGSLKPLMKGRWYGVVDNVGGRLLESALPQVLPEGAVTCCGNIGSTELHTSIFPFILRGIALYGVGSAFTPMGTRLSVWKKLAGEWKPGQLNQLATETTLEGLNKEYIDRILSGGVQGRVIVSPQKKERP